MQPKTRIDFQVAAFNLRPKKWVIHECSLCNYKCGYVFCPQHEEAGYDSGCDCTGTETIRRVSWNELADHYNMQMNEDCIREMNEFWGFK